MGWIQLFREDNSPTHYESVEVPAEWNIPLLWIAFIAVVAGIAAILWACGLKHARFRIFLRDIISLGIGISILVSIHGLSWQSGMVETRYESGNNHSHPFELVELSLGLLGFNVSYTGEHHEAGKIYLNEYIGWYPVERLQEDYMTLVKRGMPDTVLDFCELFVFEGGNINWGRKQRTGAYYSYILSWSSFALWAMGNLYMQASGIYGSMLIIFTGCLELLANVSYYAASLQNEDMLKLQFQGGKLNLEFGWSFWLTFATGLLCLFVGTLILVMTICHPDLTQLVFLYTSAHAIWKEDPIPPTKQVKENYDEENYSLRHPLGQNNNPQENRQEHRQENRSTRVKFTGDTELHEMEKTKRSVNGSTDNIDTARSMPNAGVLATDQQEAIVKVRSSSNPPIVDLLTLV